MLTTQASRDIEQNIVTDVNANVLPSTPTPQRRVLSPEAALLFDKSIVARPLMVPEVCSLHVKNSEYRYRWVFTGSGGQMYTIRRAQGFTNATTEDVDVMNGNIVADKGEIRAGDLILMKIQAGLYDAAIKHNMQKANVLQNARGMYLKGASSDVYNDDKVQRQSVAAEQPAMTGLAAPFIPDAGKLEELLDKSMSSGNVNRARETVNEMRTKIDAETAAKKVAAEAKRG